MKPHKPRPRKKAVAKGENPFEAKKNRTKFAVLGKKVKGTVVRTTRSTSAGNERRAETIGAEFELRGKVRSFLFFFSSLLPIGS